MAERYPALKASQPFQHIESRISGLETAISDRREVYNAEVNTNNVMIESFPGVLLVGLGNFPPAKLLYFDAGQAPDVNMKALFGT